MKILSCIVVLFCLSIDVRAQRPIVSTWAGAQAGDFIDGARTDARFNGPFGLAIGRDGALYVADANNNAIRKIAPDGTVTTIAGNGVAGFNNGDSTDAQFYAPSDLCVDDSDNIYICDFQNQRIRKIDAHLHVTTIAGSGDTGYVDGPAASARFNYPRGIARDRAGNLYIADSWNHRIRKITPDGTVSTFAGGGNSRGVQSAGDLREGPDTSARFNTPCGLACDSLGNILVADAYNHRIRKITPAGVVSTFAGSSTGRPDGGYVNGSATNAKFNVPTEVCVHDNGDVYVGDTFGNRIRKISQGTVNTLAGSGVPGYKNIADTLAQFSTPRGVVVKHDGSALFVNDYTNNCIRMVTLPKSSGVRDVPALPVISVYPNPTSGAFTVNARPGTVHTLRIMDAGGREISSVLAVRRSALTIDLTLQPSGRYYICTGNNAPISLDVVH